MGRPAVKQSLDVYLGRLQRVLREFSQRQQQLATPPWAVSTMAEAHQVDAQTQAATNRLRTALASATNANDLNAAFRSWLASLQRLAARGDAAARRLDLPDCESVPLTRAAAA
ncbi:MAG TPA: hypothetical protein VGF81_05930 [Solirubrobacteraceae bacterium]